MFKKGKKIVLLLLALALALGVFAACGSTYKAKPLDGYESSQNAAQSNGGSVVKKDGWYYFINGSEDYSATNTFGTPVKGALMRISEQDLAAGNYTEADIVVPHIITPQDYTGGIFIYGDYVYYATPNTVKNMDGEVESSYLDFKRTKLDGTETMTGYYVQLSDNASAYRYVEENGVVYLLYVDSSNTEIHSYNTQTGTDTVLVKGYSAYQFDAEDKTNPTVYYTMSVTKKYTYPSTSTEKYNQLYKVNASATESPYTLDLSDGYTDKSLSEGDEGYEMEYINLGTIVLDGVGSTAVKTPFNIDWKEEKNNSNSTGGYTYSFVKYASGKLYLTITNLGVPGDGTASVYCVDGTLSENWNSITVNPGTGSTAGDVIVPVAVSTTNATSSALFYEEEGTMYYIYLDSSNSIVRVQVSKSADDSDYIAGSTTLARNQEGATFLFLDGGYLYYSTSGTNGNALNRIKYDGASEDYNIFSGAAATDEDYKATKYLQIDYNNSWFAPEVLGGYLFFNNAESYSENYMYVMVNPEDNNALKELNDKYTDVQDAFTDVATNFSEASNAMKYYFYTGTTEIIKDEAGEYFEQYDEEDFEVIAAFESAGSAHGFNFEDLKDYNKQSAYYNVIGKVTEDDAETIAESLKTDLLVAEEETTEDAGWTWQWAAIFVPVGVVVIAGVVVAVVLLKKRANKR